MCLAFLIEEKSTLANFKDCLYRFRLKNNFLLFFMHVAISLPC